MTKENLDSIIFDLDGTLWDSTYTIAKARNTALKRLGIHDREVTRDQVAKTIGKPVVEVYRLSFPDLPIETHEKIRQATYEEMQKLLPIEGALLYPGLREGLIELEGHYPLFIVSNCGKGYIETFLEWSGLGPLFQGIECYGNTNQPKGWNIRSVIQRHRLNGAIYVGDTSGDHVAAQEAGIPYLHMDYGFGEPAGPCDRFKSFDELVRALI